MSVAAATPSNTKTAPLSLWTASVAGAIYVLAALAVVFYGVPQLWEMGVSPWLVPALNTAVNGFGRVVAQIAAIVLLTIFGLNLAGPHPIRGMRGGIFLAVCSIFIAFFLICGTLGVFERMAVKFDGGHAFTLVIVAAGLFFFWKFVASDRLTRWGLALEEAGWFDGNSYKRNQGVRVRRFTTLGVLVLMGSGIYTMWHHRIIGDDAGKFSIPFTQTSVTLLPDPQVTLPILLCAFALWFAWRVVNFPVFADFLVATEAEINKVSWTPRARLIQDTIVVLATLFIITLFLFVVDIFWGYFLSRVNVLPTEDEMKNTQTQQVITNEW